MTTEAATAPQEGFRPARIVLRPTSVRSIQDGQTHQIGAEALAQLYGVPLRCCTVVRDEDVAQGWLPAPDDLVLHVRYDGKYYAIPQEWYA